MSAITFQACGDPKGQPRPRAFAMRKAGGGFTARVFDSGTAEGWKSLIALAAKPHAPKAPITGPVELRVAFVFRRPASHFRGGRHATELRPDAPAHHISKPDTDNLLKAVMDALTQTGLFWGDDAQVCTTWAWKSYGARPGALVEIRAIGEVAQ